MLNQFLENPPPNSFDRPLRWLIRPALFLAIAIHGVLLFTPLPAQKKPSGDRSQAEVETQIARLPTLVSPKPVLSPKVPLRSPSQPIPPRVAPSQPAPRLPTQPTAAQPTLPVPKLPLAPSSAPSPQPAPVVDQAPPPTNLQIPFANFPDLAGAQVGCFGSESCRQVSDGVPFRNAAQTLEQQMVAQGYEVSERDDLSDTGQKIYQLKAQDGATRYLSVLSSAVGATIYLISPEPVTLNDLQQTETVKANLAALLGQLGTAAIATQIPYPTLFLSGTAPRPEVEQMRLVPGITPDQLASTLTPTLQDQQFSLSAVGTYGGGKMYEVGKEAFMGYVNLVPTADKTGTVMVLWNTAPS